MTIHIESLTFDAIIGLLDFEREHTQRVIIDMMAEYPYETADSFVDYADIAILMAETLKTARYALLEEALIGLESVIINRYPQITSLYLKISKPDILDNCTVALSHHWDY